MNRVVPNSSFAAGVAESGADKDAEAGSATALSMQADAVRTNRRQHDAEKTFGNHSRRAFTMIELTVVLLIAAIAASAVTLRMRRPLQTAKARNLAGAIGQFDRVTRVAAQQQDRPLVIRIDPAGGVLVRTDHAGRRLETPPLRLPKGFRITELWIQRRRSVEQRHSIPISRQGLSPSYAMLIIGDGHRQWIATAGLTGLSFQPETDAQARDMFAEIGPRSNAR